MDSHVQDEEHQNHVFSMRACVSDCLNFSESIFLLFGSDQYMIIMLRIALLGSFINNFKYHFVPSFHSRKYGLIRHIQP